MGRILHIQSDASNLAILDIHGTLTETVALHRAVLEEAMRSFDFPALDMD